MKTKSLLIEVEIAFEFRVKQIVGKNIENEFRHFYSATIVYPLADIYQLKFRFNIKTCF